MKVPRQYERRARFQSALNDMPRFETWTTYHDDVGHYYLKDDPAITRKKEHAKLVPRKVRRDMARQLSKRQYRAEHGLPEI